MTKIQKEFLGITIVFIASAMPFLFLERNMFISVLKHNKIYISMYLKRYICIQLETML